MGQRTRVIFVVFALVAIRISQFRFCAYPLNLALLNVRCLNHERNGLCAN